MNVEFADSGHLFKHRPICHIGTEIWQKGCYYYEKKEDLPQGRHLYWERMGDGTLLINMTRVKGNGAKIDDINYAEKECLKQAFSIAHYLQRNGFEHYIISHIAGQTGVRETNQLVGLYTLTEDDLTSGRRFPDVVAQTNYEIDIHSPDGAKVTDERHIDGYDIPYRCMIPPGIEWRDGQFRPYMWQCHRCEFRLRATRLAKRLG